MNFQLTKVVTRCLIGQIVTLEFALDTDVNPDFAIKMIEDVAAVFQNLNVKQTEELTEIIEEFADEMDNEKYKVFVFNILDSFGLSR